LVSGPASTNAGVKVSCRPRVVYKVRVVMIPSVRFVNRGRWPSAGYKRVTSQHSKRSLQALKSRRLGAAFAAISRTIFR
jgi:hypothetical protein